MSLYGKVSSLCPALIIHAHYRPRVSAYKRHSCTIVLHLFFIVLKLRKNVYAGKVHLYVPWAYVHNASTLWIVMHVITGNAVRIVDVCPPGQCIIRVNWCTIMYSCIMLVS